MKKEALEKLLADMSIDEKIGQLVQITAQFYEDDTVVTGPASKMALSEAALSMIGSVLGSTGAGKLKKIQEAHMEKHPHHIPLLFMGDVINGFKTIFPIPLGQGASFDPVLSGQLASIAAKEAAVSGLHVTFSPMADLARDARWGRVMESTGEDVYMNGRFAEEMVKGYQGKNIADPYRIAACIKHFAAYGAPTAGRDYNNVELSERTLREDYLPAYQKAVDAGCALAMASFNSLNRIPSTANRWLLHDVLRAEMGFKGVVISDWAAIEELICHGVAENTKEAARLAFEAGVDIDMMTAAYASQLKALIEEGAVRADALDAAAMRVLELKNKLGLFEHPYKDADEATEKQYILCSAHRKAAREAAAKSFVLLKNEGVLPLKKQGESIAFIGPYAEERWVHGAWSIFADEKNNVTLKEGIANKLGLREDIRFAKGAEILDEGQTVADFAKSVVSEVSAEAREKLLSEAVEAAAASDKVVLALGEHPAQSGEAASRAELTLSDGQMELLRHVSAVNKNTAVVLFTGRPLDLRAVEKYAKSVLVVWFPGTESGNAIADVLFADVCPSGRLPMSFPYAVGQVPVFYSEFSTGRPAALTGEDSRFGSKYLDIPNKPLHPFGFGLTYTQFSYSPVTLSRTHIAAHERVTASVTVENTGGFAAEETVQLYIKDDCAGVIRPVRALKGFKKVFLKPGERACVSFEIGEAMLRFYNINMEYKSEPGAFTVFVGGSSETQNCARFMLEPETEEVMR